MGTPPTILSLFLKEKVWREGKNYSLIGTMVTSPMTYWKGSHYVIFVRYIYTYIYIYIK